MPAHKRRRVLVLLAVVAALGALGVGAAFSATSLAAPTVTSAPPAATNSRAATFTFTGPGGAAFRCSLDGATASTCTSPRNYGGLADGLHTFSVVAVKGNETSAATTVRWTVDTVAPKAPLLTTKPSDPTYTATNDFAWTSAEAGLTSECALENGTWSTCSSPYRWIIGTDNYGQHQFSVRSRDAAGNLSVATTYVFKYEKKLPDSGVPFKISGTTSNLLIGVWQTIPLTVTNPNSVAIYVSALRVDAGDGTSTTCKAVDNLELEQSNVATTRTLVVPAGGSVTLPAQGVTAPRIRLKNLATVNQDACKSKTFTLSYSGTATN